MEKQTFYWIIDIRFLHLYKPSCVMIAEKVDGDYYVPGSDYPFNDSEVEVLGTFEVEVPEMPEKYYDNLTEE